MAGRRLLALAVAVLVAVPHAVVLEYVPAQATGLGVRSQSDGEPQRASTVPGRVVDPVTDVPLLVSPAPAEEPLELPVGSSSSGVDADGVPVSADPPAIVEELLEERTATQQVFLTEDGSKIVEMFVYPWFSFDDRSGSWVEIDPSIAPVERKSGVVSAVLGDWSVEFGSLESDGTRMVTAAGELQVVPREATGQPQIVEGDDTVVRYSAAWPGVDLKYSVSASSVREEIVVFDRGARSSFVFDLRGATVRAAKANAGLLLDGPLWELLSIAPLVVFDASGKSIQAPVTMSPVDGLDGKAGSAIQIDVDADWLKALPDAAFPLTIDPDFVRPGAYRSVSDQGGVFNGLMAGRDTFGAVWRAVADFDYEDLLNQPPVPYSVGNATLRFQKSGSTPSYAPDIRAYEATGSTLASVTFAGAVGDGTPDGSFVGGFNDVTWWNGTSMMTPWFASNTANKMVGVTADESAGASLRTYSGISFSLRLIRPATPTSLTTPANNSIISTLTPNLQAVAVTHPDSPYEQTAYYFEITTGNSPGSGALVSSGWTAQWSWTPPVGSLVDGVTYYGWVYTNRLAEQQPAPHAPHGPGYVPPIEPTVSRRFKVDLRLGGGGPSPMDQVGTVGGVSSTPSEGLPSTGTPGSALNVNLVTGNLSVGVSSHGAGSLGGPMAIGLTYNSQAAVGAGLTGEYFADYYPAGQITETDTMLLKRLDHTINFDWGDGSPGPGVPVDNFAARWTGQIVAPAGTWNFQDGYLNNFKVWIDGNPLQLAGFPYASGTDVTFVAGVPRDIRVEASFGTGIATGASLSMYNPNVAGCNISPCIASAGWLSPEVSSAPDGWTVAAGFAGVSYVSVTDLGDSVAAVAGDGSSREFRRVSPGVYAPPNGSRDLLTVDGVGAVTIQSSNGITSAFRADGQLASITTAIDDDVSQPATHQYLYDSSGRLITVRDPVTNRDLTVVYGGSGNCPVPVGYPAAPDGKLCEIRTWDNRVTQLIYDPWSRVQRIIAPGSRVIDIGYDEYNRIVEWRDPLAADAYDNYTIGSQTLHNIIYDSAGRVSSIQGPAPLPNEPRAKSTYTYDPVNRRTRVTADGFNPTAGGGYARQVRYDTRLRITETTDSAGQVTTIEWDDQDRVIATTAPGGFRSTTRYNTTGCTLNTAGRNTNRTTVTYTAGGGTGSYCYDNADRLTAAPGIPANQITYDDRGNTTLYGTQTFTWDATGRHATTQTSTSTITYTYDPLDRIRTRTTTGTSPQDHRYVYTGHGDTADALYTTAGTLVEAYYSLPGGILYTKRASGDRWSYPNLHGDIIAIADNTGTRTATPTTYDNYGRHTTTPDNTTPNADYAWHGTNQKLLEHQPGTQPIIEMGARPYNPDLGRFLAVDPIVGGCANDYTYGFGDPINNSDLSGRATPDCDGLEREDGHGLLKFVVEEVRGQIMLGALFSPTNGDVWWSYITFDFKTNISHVEKAVEGLNDVGLMVALEDIGPAYWFRGGSGKRQTVTYVVDYASVGPGDTPVHTWFRGNCLV